MNARFQFRVNGIIITHLKVRPVVIAGATDQELVACHETLGEFAIDDNEGLGDPALTRFVLELRDVTIPPIERRDLPNKGWQRVTTLSSVEAPKQILNACSRHRGWDREE
jgi:hypothetical protein